MGLAAAKNKRKLAKDPNNTKWSRNTDSFGHRMLRSQGWAPGQYLGPEDASHAEFHTAASASHIRVSLRADNLGLGAKKNPGDECTGLDVFKDLLGRLNGKDETVIEEQRKAREVIKMSHYIERKFGAVRFVRGGLLVGDQVQKLLEDAKAREPSVKVESADSTDESPDTAPVKKESKSKKRKAESGGDSDREDKKSEKRRRKEERRKDKSKKKKKDRSVRSGSPSPEDVESSKSKKSSTKKSKSKRKAEESKSRDESSSSEKTERDSDDAGDSAPSEAAAAVMAGRHLARKRFIAQKRRAIMDPAALNQIFMIKT